VSLLSRENVPFMLLSPMAECLILQPVDESAQKSVGWAKSSTIMSRSYSSFFCFCESCLTSVVFVGSGSHWLATLDGCFATLFTHHFGCSIQLILPSYWFILCVIPLPMEFFVCAVRCEYNF